MKKVLVFYGEECPHCKVMMPVIDQVEKEQEGKIKFEKLEVWHNENNLATVRKFKPLIKTSCGEKLLVPIFFHEKSQKSLCGQVSYETLREWVEGL